MRLKLLKIPILFSINGLLWAFFANRLIGAFTKDCSQTLIENIRFVNNFAFVGGTAVLLYFGIKQQYDRLVDSEVQYKNLFESNPNPMWIINLKTHRFIEVNEATVFLYGYSRSEFLKMTIEDIGPTEELIKLSNYVKSFEQGIRQPGNWKHLKKSGEILTVSIVAYGMDFNGIAATLFIATNVTEIIQKSEKIKAQNKMLQDIVWSYSHELRRPVCSIVSLAELLTVATTPDEGAETVALLQLSISDLDEILKNTNRKVDELDRV